MPRLTSLLPPLRNITSHLGPVLAGRSNKVEYILRRMRSFASIHALVLAVVVTAAEDHGLTGLSDS